MGTLVCQCVWKASSSFLTCVHRQDCSYKEKNMLPIIALISLVAKGVDLHSHSIQYLQKPSCKSKQFIQPCAVPCYICNSSFLPSLYFHTVPCSSGGAWTWEEVQGNVNDLPFSSWLMWAIKHFKIQRRLNIWSSLLIINTPEWEVLLVLWSRAKWTTDWDRHFVLLYASVSPCMSVAKLEVIR